MMKDSASFFTRGLNIILHGVVIVLALAGLFMTFAILGVWFVPDIQYGFITYIDADSDHLPSHYFALVGFFSLIMIVAYLSIVIILRAVVKTLLTGDPFVIENIRRLRLMWILIALSEIFRMCVHNLALRLVRTEPAKEMVIDVSISTWFLVFVVAALSEAFVRGTELRQDQKYTV